jgi:hypothetical protein
MKSVPNVGTILETDWLNESKPVSPISSSSYQQEMNCPEERRLFFPIDQAHSQLRSKQP